MNRKQRRAGRKKGGDTPASDAESRYRQLLQSGEPLALHAFGVRAHQAGRNDIAAQAIARAIALDAGVPEFHYNLGIVLKALNRLDEAALSYRHALALKPDYAQAYNNLGNVLRAQGARAAARDCFMQALTARPDFAEAHYSLANLLLEEAPDVAADHLRACLAIEPADGQGAGLLLARLGQAPTPDRASPAHLERTYAARSQSWGDEKGYRGHELVARALRQAAGNSRTDILDAGCGTGLAGSLLRDLAGRLDGIDLSGAMLEKAQAKAVYDDLHQGDLVSFLVENPARYDAIAAAAVLIHFGDLAPLFRAASAALRSGGLFVFTVFPHDGEADFSVAPDIELAKGGCFSHSPGYVSRLARASGFAVESLDHEAHEFDRSGAPVTGLIVTLRRIE